MGQFHKTTFCHGPVIIRHPARPGTAPAGVERAGSFDYSGCVQNGPHWTPAESHLSPPRLPDRGKARAAQPTIADRRTE